MNVATTNNFEMNYVVAICATLIFVAGHCSGQISSKLDFGTSETTTSEYDSTLSSSLVKALVSLQHSTGPQKTVISSKLDQNPFNLRSIAPLVRQNPKTDFTSLGVICVEGRCNTTDSKAASSGEKLSTDILVQVVTNIDNKKENKTAATTGEDNDVPIVVGYGGTNLKPDGLEHAARRIDGNQDVTITTGTGQDNKFDYNYYNLGKHNDVLGKDNHNQFNHQVQYFEPRFNNHYFGESPPPQFVWYRRRNGQQNPHAFNFNMNPVPRPFKPYNNQWQLKYPSSSQTQSPNGWSHTTTCSCSNPGLNWYPSFGPHQPTPAAPVNDKMNPLN